jgi:hypothetical protein
MSVQKANIYRLQADCGTTTRMYRNETRKDMNLITCRDVERDYRIHAQGHYFLQ